MTLVFKKEALEDLVRIADYGVRHFGAEAARACQAWLSRAFASIEKFPKVDRIRYDLKGQPRLRNLGGHIIVYTIVPEGVEIIRILGGRQNISELL